MGEPGRSRRGYVRADEGSEILVLEDHPATLEFLRFALTDSGYRVRTAMSAAQGIGALGSALPDLLVLDLMLPDAHGLDICRHLKELPGAEDLPILVITEDDRPQSHGEAVRAGVDDFLRKPILATELQTRVRSLLRLRRLRQQLRHEKESILSLQIRQEEMVQFVMHDMKNMLSALLARADLFEESRTEADWKRHHQGMTACARALQEMVSNFLDLSLADQAAIPLHPERIDLAEWLPHLVGEFENVGVRRRHSFEVAVAPDLDFHADAHLLRRALFNLLDNASKYAPDHSTVSVTAEAVEARVRLAVSDQGPGVPDAFKEQIFERLFLVDGSGHSHRGKGLGLAFCRMVAERHGGSIKVEDNRPTGSVFLLDFPAGPHPGGS